MVDYQPQTLDRVFAAVSDETRRAILRRLRQSPATVGEIAEPFGMSLNGVSKHLKVLERAGLIRREIVGREHRCRLEAAPLAQAAGWLETYRAFWEDRLDALERHLAGKRGKERSSSRRSPRPSK